jgi:hypothetical protein
MPKQMLTGFDLCNANKAELNPAWVTRLYVVILSPHVTSRYSIDQVNQEFTKMNHRRP